MYLRKQVKRQQAKINFHPFVTERTLTLVYFYKIISGDFYYFFFFYIVVVLPV